MTHDDFAFEPIEGLPEKPPAGESILWQGRPEWRALAWRAFYVRPVAIYFAVLMIWRLVEAIQSGGSVTGALFYALDLAPFAAAAMGVLLVLAYAYARSTVYTVTSRRLVVRSGIALPMTVNIPFKLVQSASLKVHRDGTGDLPLALVPSANVTRLALWPNVRSWRWSTTEPMLRSLNEPQHVAEILSRALATSATAEGAPAPKVAAKIEKGRRWKTSADAPSTQALEGAA